MGYGVSESTVFM
jgi:hypothetical protein